MNHPAPDLWQLSDDELTTRLLACETHLNRDYANMLAVVGEVKQRGLAESRGYKDCPAFLTQALRVSGREAKQRLTLAEATMPSSSLTGVPQPPALAATGE